MICSHGAFPGTGQFGVIDVFDPQDPACLAGHCDYDFPPSLGTEEVCLRFTGLRLHTPYSPLEEDVHDYSLDTLTVYDTCNPNVPHSTAPVDFQPFPAAPKVLYKAIMRLLKKGRKAVTNAVDKMLLALGFEAATAVHDVEAVLNQHGHAVQLPPDIKASYHLSQREDAPSGVWGRLNAALEEYYNPNIDVLYSKYPQATAYGTLGFIGLSAITFFVLSQWLARRCAHACVRRWFQEHPSDDEMRAREMAAAFAAASGERNAANGNNARRRESKKNR